MRDKNLFPIRNFLSTELRRLATCVGKKCQTVAEKIPLTKKQQLEIQRQKEKEQREREKRQKEREQKQKAPQK